MDLLVRVVVVGCWTSYQLALKIILGATPMVSGVRT